MVTSMWSELMNPNVPACRLQPKYGIYQFWKQILPVFLFMLPSESSHKLSYIILCFKCVSWSVKGTVVYLWNVQTVFLEQSFTGRMPSPWESALPHIRLGMSGAGMPLPRNPTALPAGFHMFVEMSEDGGATAGQFRYCAQFDTKQLTLIRLWQIQFVRVY